jgi:hypothetical protein
MVEEMLSKLLQDRHFKISAFGYTAADHADAADGYGISQDAFLETFPLRVWVTLDNLFQRYEIRRYTSEANQLYILAEKSLPNLIRIEDQSRASNTQITTKIQPQQSFCKVSKAFGTAGLEKASIGLKRLARDHAR